MHEVLFTEKLEVEDISLQVHLTVVDDVADKGGEGSG